MKYSKMMERATLYYAPVSKRGLQEIRQVERTLCQLRVGLKDVETKIERLADQRGLLRGLRDVNKKISVNAQLTHNAKRCSKGGKGLKNANRASGTPPKTREDYIHILSILEKEKVNLLATKAHIEKAVRVEASKTDLLKKQEDLKKQISSLTRTLNKAKKRGSVTVSPKSKQKRRNRSVRTVSGGGVSPR